MSEKRHSAAMTYITCRSYLIGTVHAKTHFIFISRAMFQNSSPVDLTYISLTSIDKQNSPRSDAAKRGVPSGAFLFAYNTKFIENKIEMKRK